MRALARLWLISVGVICGCQEEGKPIKTDFDRLQGDWALVSGERNGEALAPSAIKDVRLTFAGNRLITKKPEGSTEATFVLLPQAKSKGIDLDMGGSVGLGIYKLEEDSLSILHGEIEQPRPKDFDDVKAGNLTLLVLTRIKD
jgi:uncharacterized protein (TIGR03067 family)